MVLKFKKLNGNAVKPTRGSKYAAGYDLYANLPESTAIIRPGETAKIKTGISMEIPEGRFGAIYPRSGLATKNGLRLANCVGIVDQDFRGDITVPIHNDTNIDQIIHNNDRIAQIVIQPYENVDLVESEELSDTERGIGGFGSTGVGVK